MSDWFQSLTTDMQRVAKRTFDDLSSPAENTDGGGGGKIEVEEVVVAPTTTTTTTTTAAAEVAPPSQKRRKKTRVINNRTLNKEMRDHLEAGNLNLSIKLANDKTVAEYLLDSWIEADQRRKESREKKKETTDAE